MWKEGFYGNVYGAQGCGGGVADHYPKFCRLWPEGQAALEDDADFGEAFVVLGSHVEGEVLFFSGDGFAGGAALDEEEIERGFLMFAGGLEQELFGVEGDLEEQGAVGGGIEGLASYGDAQRGGFERTFGGFAQRIVGCRFVFGAVGNSKVALAITELRCVGAGLDFDFAKFSVPLIVVGVEADGVGVAAVVEGAVNGFANVVVAEESQAAGAVGEELGGITVVVAIEESAGVGSRSEAAHVRRKAGIELRSVHIDGIDGDVDAVQGLSGLGDLTLQRAGFAIGHGQLIFRVAAADGLGSTGTRSGARIVGG